MIPVAPYYLTEMLRPLAVWTLGARNICQEGPRLLENIQDKYCQNYKLIQYIERLLQPTEEPDDSMNDVFISYSAVTKPSPKN
jgi:hypothetical protein